MRSKLLVLFKFEDEEGGYECHGTTEILMTELDRPPDEVDSFTNHDVLFILRLNSDCTGVKGRCEVYEDATMHVA